MTTITNDTKKPKHTIPPIKSLAPWLMWGLAVIFYTYEFLLQVSPSVLVQQLEISFHISATEVGNVAAFYFYAYALMQIPVGILLDRYGVRRIIPCAIAICGIGTILFASSNRVGIAELSRLLIGIGSAFAVIGVFKLISNWFAHRHFALLAGITVSLGMLGAVFGEAPLAFVSQHFSWRYVMYALGIGGLCYAIILRLVLRDTPSQASIPIHRVKSGQHLFSHLFELLKRPQAWLLSVYAGLMFVCVSAFGALWGVPFLVASYSITTTTAGALNSLIFIGFALGSPFFGWLSDNISKRKTGMIIGAVISLVDILIILYVPNLPTVILGLMIFKFGFFLSGMMPAFSMMRDINHVAVTATAISFMNMLNMLGGAFAQPGIGYILDFYWQGNLVNGAKIYPASAYHIALAILPICLSLACLLLPFIRETYCRAER